MSDMVNIPIEFKSDEKGYYDRQCPTEKCEFVFKIYMDDWKEKVSDEKIFCPMCGHVAPSDQWYTHEQVESIQEIATSYAMSYLSNEIDKMFGEMGRNTKSNKYFKMTYNPRRKVTFENNPIGQKPEWELEITCEKCETRYSVIGSAYFCPCCGHNSVERVFYESLDTVEKMIDSLSDISQTFEKSFGRDKAESMCRSMLEGTLGDIISAFQKYAEDIYINVIPSKKVRTNDFQIVEKGSNLFREGTGKGYDCWLSNEEIKDMNTLFQQRHLIEHNNGLIDERYIQNSNDNTYQLGQRVIIRSIDALRLIAYVRKLSIGLKGLVKEMK